MYIFKIKDIHIKNILLEATHFYIKNHGQM